MTRAALLLAAIALVSSAPAARTDAKPEIRFDRPDGLAEIPFDLHNNHIFIRGQVNGSDSLWFVLDTGAAGHVMSISRARGLGLPMTRRGYSQGVGGRVESSQVEDLTLRLPGLTLAHQQVGAIPLDAIELQSGRPMDVILGYPFFRECVVEIDYAGRRLRVWKEGRAPERTIGVPVPIELLDQHPYVKASVQMPDGKPIEGRFVIDTGAASALLLDAAFVEKHRLLEKAGPTIRVRLGGVGGAIENPLGRVERLQLGPYALAKPVTAFRVAGGGYTSARGTAGNIGGDVMRRFRVTFDYGKKRMTLEPNAGLEDAFEADMTGLMFQVDSTRTLRVTGVQPGSPAAEAGIGRDDVIEEVDGRAVAEIGIQALRPLFKSPEKTLRFTVRRGTERRTVNLTTRRLI